MERQEKKKESKKKANGIKTQVEEKENEQQK